MPGKLTGRLIILAMLVVIVAQTGRGQSSIWWTAVKTMEGSSEPGWHAVSFTPQGGIIASRLNGPQALVLSGYSMSNFPAPMRCVSRICENATGQKWGIVPEGLVELGLDGTWINHPVSEIWDVLHASKISTDNRPMLLPVRQGTVLFLLPGGLYEFISDNQSKGRVVTIRTAQQEDIGRFSGMVLAHDGGLWISGSHGLAKVPGPVRALGPTLEWQQFHPPDSLGLTNFTHPITDLDDGVVALADSLVDGKKDVVTFDHGKWVGLSAGALNFNHVWRGQDGSLWASTAAALFEWRANQTNWDQYKEKSFGRIFDVTVEPDGAIWLASSTGLFRGALPMWSVFPTIRNWENPLRCLTSGEQGAIYFADGGKLFAMCADTLAEYMLPNGGEGAATAPMLYSMKNGSVVLAMDRTVYQLNLVGKAFEPLVLTNGMSFARPVGRLPDGTVCFQIPTGLASFDGKQMNPLPNPPPLAADDELFTTLLASKSGDFWLGGPGVVMLRHDDKWQRFASDDPSMPESAVGFAEVDGGKIFCAAADKLWTFDGIKWLPAPSRFDHINCLLQCHNGTVWLGANNGLYRYNNGDWLGNGTQEGLPEGPVTALCEDTHGNVWAATPHNLAVYHPAVDKSPPKTELYWLAGSKHHLTEGDTLNLLFDGQDKWKTTAHERLLYSYRLDQQEWSVFQDMTVYSGSCPPTGQHTFEVRAMNRNGFVDPVPASVAFTVVTPWFKETRLLIIMAFGAVSVIFFAGIALNRHITLLRSHAEIERKVAERTRALELATQELLHSQKMNALGTLAAGIAHDFNNILSIIKGSAQIIEDNPDKPEKIRVRVSRIKMVVQQGAEIVDAMLGYGRTAGAAAQPCDINVVVADTIKLLGERFQREVEVKLERADRLPEIATARDLIQQILLNFIFNAAEAMTDRKKITLTTRALDKLPPDLFLNPGQSTSYVMISVRDEGAGMTPEIKARIFEPFFTTKALSTRRGTGLGLSMVYELAKKLGAGLAVQSVVGRGSTFMLVLPVLARPAKKIILESSVESSKK